MYHFPLDYNYYHEEIKQGYLVSSKDLTIRVRESVSQYGKREFTQTIKCGRGKGYENLGVTEIEFEPFVCKEDQDKLFKMCEGSIIRKTRYSFFVNNCVVYIDVFKGAYKGLVVAEVEFESEQDAKEFEPLGWFGEEVTNDSRYSDAVMAVSHPKQVLSKSL